MIASDPDRAHGRLLLEAGVEVVLTETCLRRVERGVEQFEALLLWNGKETLKQSADVKASLNPRMPKQVNAVPSVQRSLWPVPESP